MGVLNRGLYGPFLAQLVLVRKCNLTCGYCNEFDEVSEPVALDVLKARVDKLKALGTFSLELTGGEPMLHPEIDELIRYARNKSFHKVMMISNAYLLNEKKVRALNAVGLMELQVLYVDEFGDIHWCSQTRGVSKKPLLEYRKSDLKTQFYTKKTCADACTIGCVRTQSAYDEWRAQPLSFGGARRLPLVQG